MRLLSTTFLFISLLQVNAQQLSFALEQINGQAIIDAGLTGKGVKVGIIDGGFLRADKTASLEQLFQNGQVIAYKDYLNPEAGEFSGSIFLDDGHGTEVWELIAGFNKEKNVQYGLATGATFYLARTDHGGFEKRIEEEYAIAAMEWMAQQGVKIINMSLGYNFGYTDKKENYEPSQMDGKSTILTQAVDRMAKEYGILVVVAAGNDGKHKWRIVGSPGDAKSALTVGATKFKVWDKMNYSSEGPEWLEYVKPEISCYASTGTSFATPVITGLAACLLERDSTLSGAELKNIILNSGNLTYPNNYIGHGVPDAAIALKIQEGDEILWDNEAETSKSSYVLVLPQKSIYTTLYHKNGWKVIGKETLRTNKSKIKIKRAKEATATTVIWEGGSFEVIWD